jgi:alpha-tubulin suppressor-like RCC1 family protein
VASIACGYSHTVFVKGDKTVWATGCNATGQLGLGHTNQQNSPVQVAAVGNDVTSVACGNQHTIFVKADKVSELLIEVVLWIHKVSELQVQPVYKVF